MNELNGIDKWVYEKLASDSRIRGIVGRHSVEQVVQVYWLVAPLGASYPYIIFGKYTGRDINGSGARRVMVSTQYKIEAYDQFPGITTAIELLSDYIDELVQSADDENDTIVLGARRDYPTQGMMQQAGYMEVFQGGVYEILVAVNG